MNAFNSCDGFASLNRTFHLSPHENICTIALITIHYLYNNACKYIHSIVLKNIFNILLYENMIIANTNL